MALLGICNPVGQPAWTRIASIGDYGGATDKCDSETEGATPYAASVYLDIQGQRGSAYTTKTGTLVHVENLALARTLAAVNFRNPEKLRANATPIKADELLDYWVTVLGVPLRTNEERWQLRQRTAAHYQAAKGNTYVVVRDAVSALLGAAFVDLVITTGSALSSPPTQTYWPGVNPGDSSYSLGGGTWISERCRYFVKATQPNGMTDSEFNDLIRTQLFQLMDRIIPVWATYGVGVQTTSGASTGFLLDLSKLDITAMDNTP